MNINKMLVNTRLKIVRGLIENPRQTIRELSRTTKTTYYLIQKNITHLHKSGVVKQEKVGRSLVCSLDHKKALALILVAELNKKEEFFKQNNVIRLVLEDLQEKAETPFFTLLVFGSYAKHQQKKESDIDLLVIVERAEQATSFEALTYDISRTTSLKLHTTIVDKKSFEKMLRKPKELNVANESLNSHTIVHGAEAYWLMRIKNE